MCLLARTFYRFCVPCIFIWIVKILKSARCYVWLMLPPPPLLMAFDFVRSLCLLIVWFSVSPIYWLLISYFGLPLLWLDTDFTIAKCETNWICYGNGCGHSPFVPLPLFGFRARLSRCSFARSFEQCFKNKNTPSKVTFERSTRRT